MERSDALAHLPTLYRQVLAHADQGLEGAELAEELGVDPATVSSLLSVARSKLAALEALPAEERTDE